MRWPEIGDDLQLEIATIYSQGTSKKVESRLFNASPEGLASAVSQAAKWNSEGKNVYFGPNPIKKNVVLDNSRRPSDTHVAGCVYCFVDADDAMSSKKLKHCNNFHFMYPWQRANARIDAYGNCMNFCVQK